MLDTHQEPTCTALTLQDRGGSCDRIGSHIERDAMRNAHVVGVVFLLYTGVAAAWGPATHMYIAQCVAESQHDDILFGAALPDLNATLSSQPQIASALNRLTHFEADLLPPSYLAIGMVTHNGDWGADYYAHIFFHPEDPDSATTYSSLKISEFRSVLGVTSGQAEDLLEMTMDYLVRMDNGPQVGNWIVRSARAFGPHQEQMMVGAFAQPLSDRVPGLALEDAESNIRTACAAFKFLTDTFGIQLQREDEDIASAIPPLLARYMHIDEETAATYFEYAVAACQEDHQAELDRICANIRSRFADMPEYEMPLGPGAAILVAVLLLACAARKLRRNSGRHA